ncbi:MAG: hypothetical protein XD95_0356 [Microgenomates bacterium 39_7]|nr:MAG: hypothetical protein XD95_0356 [Microgenomates bacterium 39_7]
MATSKQKNITKTLARFYKKPVTKVSLELFFSLFAIIFFTVFAIKPTLETIAGLVKEIEDKEQLNEQLQRKVVSLATAQEEYQRLSSKIHFLDQAIPTQPQLVYSLKIVERLATENNIVINSIRLPEIPDEKSQHSATTALNRVDIYLNVSVLGDYQSIRDMVSSLHQYRRSLIVEEVTFSVEDKMETQQLRAALSIRVPYFGVNSAK